MKPEHFRPIRHQLESRAQDYLLSLRVDGLVRKIIWNDRQTLLLDHPQGWTIAKVDGTIYISDSSEPEIVRRIQTQLTIAAIERNKVTIEVPASYNKARTLPMILTVEPLIPLPPPYKQVFYDGPANPKKPRQLLMYQGVRHFLLKYRPVGSKLTTKAGKSQIFSYEKTSTGYNVTAFTTDLQVKRQGRKQELIVGVPFAMREAEFLSSSFIYGINWWRFRSVISPNALPPLEEDETEVDAREASRFQFASRSVIAFLFFALCTSVIYNFAFPPKPKLISTRVELRAVKVIPHAEIAEVKPVPPPPVPEKPPEVVKEKPKPIVEKKIAKKEPVKKEKIAKKEPIKAPPKQVLKSEPPMKKDPLPMPVKKAIDVPPAPGVVAKKNDAPPAPDDSAQLLKSLSFLSSGAKSPKQGGLAKYDKSDKAKFMSSPTLGGSTKDSATLDKISSTSTDTNIKTRSSRMIASDSGIEKGKGLNDVQGKVSLTELYKGGGGGFSEGSSMSLSGPGDLSESEIEKALSKFLSKFQFCYEKSLLTDSSLAGNIRLQWTITTSGHVSESKVVNSQMKNAGLQSCILNVLKEVPFPQPKGGSVTAKKTFSFKSSSI